VLAVLNLTSRLVSKRSLGSSDGHSNRASLQNNSHARNGRHAPACLHGSWHYVSLTTLPIPSNFFSGIYDFLWCGFDVQSLPRKLHYKLGLRHFPFIPFFNQAQLLGQQGSSTRLSGQSNNFLCGGSTAPAIYLPCRSLPSQPITNNTLSLSRDHYTTCSTTAPTKLGTRDTTLGARLLPFADALPLSAAVIAAPPGH
jgi:hypothetical protein